MSVTHFPAVERRQEMRHGAETTEIWNQMHERLLSSIRRRVASLHDAEDILQDVFVRIHAKVQHLDNAQSVAAWVYQIARNVITDYYRHRATAAGARTGPLDQNDAAVPGCPAEEDITRQAGEDFALCLEPMLDELPEDYRQAVELTELEGVSQKDAAKMLGLSVSGMKSRVQRGRGKLKDVILACCEVEFDQRGGLVDYRRRSDGICGEDACGEGG